MERPTIQEIERFMSFVTILPNGCWYWRGARSRGAGNSQWYGTFKYRGKSIRAHRFMSDYVMGNTCPEGYHRDHTCSFSLCVCPKHIEVVTREENQRRKRTQRPKWIQELKQCGWNG